jgi:hypothetical protein
MMKMYLKFILRISFANHVNQIIRFLTIMQKSISTKKVMVNR